MSGLGDARSAATGGRPPVGGHAVQFYADDQSVAWAVDRMVGPGFAEGAAAVIVATPVHRQLVRRALADRGADLAALEAQGHCVMLDAAETLGRLVVGNHLEPRAFAGVIGDCVRRAAQVGGTQPVRAFGEMVGLLHDAGYTDTALELEAQWSGLLGREPLSLLCGYPARSFAGEDKLASFMRVCGAHDHLVADDRGAAAHVADDRLRELAGIAEMPSAPIGLLEIVRQAAEEIGERMVARGQMVSIDVPAFLKVDGNAKWLTRMFIELLDNASKFSPTGVIAVRADGRGPLVVSIISDDGVGIAPSILGPMFDPFVQPDRPLTHEPEALGLGLTIVRRIVELHDGTVSAHSNGPCRGARIVVTLPRA